MPTGRYLFMPFLRTKSQKVSEENIGQAKNRIKKTDRTNIIATNFVWEQLNTDNRTNEDKISKTTKISKTNSILLKQHVG